MERQRSFSFKSTRFLLFSFTISSSIIFLTFFSFWIIKSTPSIIPETHLQLSKPPINASEKSISIETLTGFGRNFTVANAKSLILIDTQLAKPGNTSGFANSTVSGDTQRVENNTRVLEDEAIMDDGLDADSLSKSQESEAAPFLEEIVVQSNDKLDEKKIQAASDEKIELPIDQQIRRKKIRATSVKKIKDLPSKQGIEETRTRDCDITKGRWVYDESYPLYTNATCPFIDEGFNCMSNGRLDKNYMKWKWQPYDCDIPRYIFFLNLNFIYLFGITMDGCECIT